MPKNVNDLSPVSEIQDTDVFYLAEGGLADKSATGAILKDAPKDYGVIYDPPTSQGFGGSLGGALVMLGSSKLNNRAKTFSLDETTGLFTFNTGAVGLYFRIDFTLAAPISLKDRNYYAQVRYRGSQTVDTLIAQAYVSASSSHVGLSGSAIVRANANADTVGISLSSSVSGSFVPLTSIISLTNAS